MQKNVADRLKKLISEYGKGIKGFAHDADIPVRTVEEILAGNSLPNTKTLLKVSTLFSGKIDWLLTGNNKKLLVDHLL